MRLNYGCVGLDRGKNNKMNKDLSEPENGLAWSAASITPCGTTDDALSFLSSKAEFSTLCFSSPSACGHESRHIAVLRRRWLMIALGLEIRTIQWTELQVEQTMAWCDPLHQLTLVVLLMMLHHIFPERKILFAPPTLIGLLEKLIPICCLMCKEVLC